MAITRFSNQLYSNSSAPLDAKRYIERSISSSIDEISGAYVGMIIYSKEDDKYYKVTETIPAGTTNKIGEYEEFKQSMLKDGVTIYNSKQNIDEQASFIEIKPNNKGSFGINVHDNMQDDSRNRKHLNIYADDIIMSSGNDERKFSRFVTAQELIRAVAYNQWNERRTVSYSDNSISIPSLTLATTYLPEHDIDDSEDWSEEYGGCSISAATPNIYDGNGNITTHGTAGVMSAADKAKLDSLIKVEGGVSGDIGTATPSNDGLMSSADKVKLDRMTPLMLSNLTNGSTCNYYGQQIFLSENTPITGIRYATITGGRTKLYLQGKAENAVIYCSLTPSTTGTDTTKYVYNLIRSDINSTEYKTVKQLFFDTVATPDTDKQEMQVTPGVPGVMSVDQANRIINSVKCSKTSVLLKGDGFIQDPEEPQGNFMNITVAEIPSATTKNAGVMSASDMEKFGIMFDVLMDVDNMPEGSITDIVDDMSYGEGEIEQGDFFRTIGGTTYYVVREITKVQSRYKITRYEKATRDDFINHIKKNIANMSLSALSASFNSESDINL